MRRFLITLAAVLFCSASSWADGILDVYVAGTFTATQACVSNCTETISISFLFDPASITRAPGLDPNGWIDPSALSITSSGFLGSFSPQLSANGTLLVSWFDSYIPFKNANGDELDIHTGLGPNFFPMGTNTIGVQIYSCGIDCSAEYGSHHTFINPSFETSTVTPIAVPDDTSFLSLALTAFATVALAWRFRRRDTQAA
jgi:hypothetical protein